MHPPPGNHMRITGSLSYWYEGATGESRGGEGHGQSCATVWATDRQCVTWGLVKDADVGPYTTPTESGSLQRLKNLHFKPLPDVQ